MGDVKKWTVTFTKHIKQKRKVYQDGFLEIHSSSRKVRLYDDCETLLDSRFVKTDDIFRSGETLAFDAYLVDIGDPHGDHKPPTDLNFQGVEVDKKINEKARSQHGQNFKTDTSSVRGMKTSSGMKRVSSINLSPSRKIIREFQKSETSKYNASPTCLITTKTSVTEWQVLYTTQLTQKAKKFHDGILKVAVTGLHGMQAKLYDSTMRLLDSKFLKKDEIVRSGESLTFDGHLVEIVECEGDHKPPMNSSFQERKSCNLVEKTGIQHGLQVQTDTNFSLEWEAMYTTQVTQKAKKYHTGILRLVSCGSYKMQAILLTEDGTTLGRKYLELSKEISSGSTLELPNYLVEVGEQRKHPQREPQNNIYQSQWKDKEANVRSSADNILLSRRTTAKKLLHDGEHPNNASAQENKDPYIRSSDAGNVRSCSKVPANKPLRDAQSILSILRKPVIYEDIVKIKLEPVDSDEEKEVENFDVEANTTHFCGEENVASKAACSNLLVESNLAESETIIHNSSSISHGVNNLDIRSEAPNISRPIEKESPVVEPQVLDALHSESDGLEFMSSKDAPKSSLSSRVSSEEVKPQKKFQDCADNTEENNPEEKHMRKETNDEFPSFDLGF